MVALVGCNGLTGVNDLELVADDAAVEVAIDTGTVSIDTGTAVLDTASPALDTASDVAVDVADATLCETVDEDGDGESAKLGMCGTDCDDRNKSVFSKQTAYFSSGYLTKATTSFDYDCNGVEEPRLTTPYKCTLVGTTCTATPGWYGAIPACGKQGRWVYTCAKGFADTCTPSQIDRTQSCR